MKNKNREKIIEVQKNPYANFNIRHVTLTSCVSSDLRIKLADKVKDAKC